MVFFFSFSFVEASPLTCREDDDLILLYTLHEDSKPKNSSEEDTTSRAERAVVVVKYEAVRSRGVCALQISKGPGSPLTFTHRVVLGQRHCRRSTATRREIGGYCEHCCPAAPLRCAPGPRRACGSPSGFIRGHPIAHYYVDGRGREYI